VIRNDNEVKKAEQGQYQRYPSKSSPCDYRLRRKGNAKVRFQFFEKDEGGEFRDASQSQKLVNWWSEKVDYSIRQERSDRKI
jgi:hypothetical protein